MFQFFFQQEKKNKRDYFFYEFLLILFDGSDGFTPILLGLLIDQGLKAQNMNYLITFGLFIILFVVVRIFGSYWCYIHMDLSLKRVEKNRKIDLYQKVHSYDRHFFKKYHVGQLMNLINTDVEHITVWFTHDIKTIFYSLIHALIGIVFFFAISPFLTFGLFVFIGIIFYYVMTFSRKTKHYYEELREKNDDISHQVQDFIDGNRILRSFCHLGYEIDSIMKKYKMKLEYEKELDYKRNIFGTVLGFHSNILTVFFLIAVSYLFINQMITIGQIIILKGLIGYITNPFIRIDGFLKDYLNAKISLKRLLKVDHYIPKIEYHGKKNMDHIMHPIVFQDVSVVLEEKHILKNINIEIKPYETVAFLGLTGSGKSTITNLLLEFLKPTTGIILLGNTSFEEIDLSTIRSKTGIVFQEPFLFSDTIRNNIFFGAEEDETLLLALKKICALNFVDDLKLGFDTVIGERGVGLSGGEKQRIALARALARKPNLLILDDITSALDMETEKNVIEEIYHLDYPCTKVIIAEKVVSVKDADQIYVLDHGSILERGTHESLLKKHGYYHDIYKIQEGGHDFGNQKI